MSINGYGHCFVKEDGPVPYSNFNFSMVRILPAKQALHPARPFGSRRCNIFFQFFKAPLLFQRRQKQPVIRKNFRSAELTEVSAMELLGHTRSHPLYCLLHYIETARSAFSFVLEQHQQSLLYPSDILPAGTVVPIRLC